MYAQNLSLDLHTGTHLDAPLHVLKDGAGIETYQPEDLIAPCRVFDLSYLDERITADDLRKLTIEKDIFVLFKTRNSLRTGFDPGFVFLDAGGARYLAETGIKGVGIDALGIERDQPGHDTHRTLLSRGIVIIEGLRLAEVHPVPTP